MRREDIEQDAAIILIAMRAAWSEERAKAMTPAIQQAMVVKWARLRLRGQYATEFAHAARTTGGVDVDKLETAVPVSRIEQREEVAALLGLLTGQQREAVQLVFLDGLSQDEAAERLGITQPAVSGLIERAFESIREQTEED